MVVWYSLLGSVQVFGQQPFAGLANEEVLGIVSEGKHPTPPDCPAHQLMLDCWVSGLLTRLHRPTFNELSTMYSAHILYFILHNQLENENENSHL